MAKYIVNIVLEISDGSVEATSLSDAENSVIEDVKTRFNSNTSVTIVSSSAELE